MSLLCVPTFHCAKQHQPVESLLELVDIPFFSYQAQQAFTSHLWYYAQHANHHIDNISITRPSSTFSRLVLQQHRHIPHALTPANIPPGPRWKYAVTIMFIDIPGILNKALDRDPVLRKSALSIILELDHYRKHICTNGSVGHMSSTVGVVVSEQDVILL